MYMMPSSTSGVISLSKPRSECTHCSWSDFTFVALIWACAL